MWKPIKDFEGYYEININGDVKSIGRIIENSSLKMGRQTIKEKILSQVKGGYKRRYKIVVLNKDGKSNHKLVHRLLAEAFIPNPNNLETINHKDGNGYNNSLENLEWLSGKENTLHYQMSRADKRGVKLHRPTGLYQMRMNYNTNKSIGAYYKTKKEAYESYRQTFFEWFGKYPFAEVLNV